MTHSPTAMLAAQQIISRAGYGWVDDDTMTKALRAAAQSSVGFDPSNHHNALKCPYCNPQGALSPPREVEK